MSSFSPALLDCSRTVAAHVHLLGVRGTYPKPRQVPSILPRPSRLLQSFAAQSVRPLHLILAERAAYIQVPFFSPLPAPRRLSESLNVEECLGVWWVGVFLVLGYFGFFFHPGVIAEQRGEPRSRRHRARVQGKAGGPGGEWGGRRVPGGWAARPRHTQPGERGARGGRRGGAPRSNAGLNSTLLLPPSVNIFSSGLPLLRKLCCSVIPGREREKKKKKIVSGLQSEWGGGGNICLEIWG